MDINKVIITGASGFIGFNICKWLITKKVKVIAIINPNSNNNEKILSLSKLYNNLELIYLDLSDTSSIENTLQIHADYFFHFAAAGVERERLNQDYVERVNHIALTKILKMAKVFFPKLVISGSGFEYDVPYLADENSTLIGSSSTHSYALSKKNAYLSAKVASKDLNIIWLRPYTIYGPHESQKRIISYLINCIETQTVPTINTPHEIRDFLHIEDFISALEYILKNSKRNLDVFNIGSGEPIKVISIAKQVYALANKEFKWNSGNSFREDPPDFVANIEKLKLLGWVPKISLTEGIVRLLNHD
ncbi:MAG: hypothetical protein CME65_07985 [Halobacteriovoraceae bacterium]|nr:hypothetical protein [Halobacteriovoraceae bacterium]|tara:strand:+ start:601 stop:1515 length:915 start_codon:yes stop_codon:yes gene_type:complete